MKKSLFALSVFVSLLLIGCENSTEPTYNLVQGAYAGIMEEDDFNITFIEGGLKGGRTFSGSVQIITKNDTLNYRIMSGTHKRKSTVLFDLYKWHFVDSEVYHMEGTVSGATINGTFEKFNQEGDVIASGTWEVQRIP